MNYSHYCRKCKKYFRCTHEDPEKQSAYCPECKDRLILRYLSLDDLIINAYLSSDEFSERPVTYKKRSIDIYDQR